MTTEHELERDENGTACPRCDSLVTQASWTNGRCHHFHCLACELILPNGEYSLERVSVL